MSEAICQKNHDIWSMYLVRTPRTYDVGHGRWVYSVICSACGYRREFHDYPEATVR